MQPLTRRLSRTQTGLIVIDLQERLLPAMAEPQKAVQNSVRLAKGFGLLNLPVWATEQYRKGLGATVPEVASAITGFAPIEKLSYSVTGAPGCLDSLKAAHLQDVVICGIEAHVCVCQSALDLLDAGFRVFAVADATSSRVPDNHRIGLERMRDAGAAIVSTEMVLLELLQEAGTPLFKQMLPLIK
jgi:nicotinamidase-related amidase